VTATAAREQAPALVAEFVRYLETGDADGLFADDAFGDISFPHWRVQAGTARDLIAIRGRSHPCRGEVQVGRLESTARGFTMEFVERWEDGGQRWYCREMARCDIEDGKIVDLAIYCTGDWDESVQAKHARTVTLIRP
jgi:hypothetical protein